MSIIGMESYPVFVEVDISQGLPQFDTVGLGHLGERNPRHNQGRHQKSGYRFPRAHVTVNLAPADIKKEGTAFDLPIAVGILAAEELIKESSTRNCFFMGELSLDGSIKRVNGVLTAAFKAKEMGIAAAFVSEENALEQPWWKHNVTGVKNLTTSWNFSDAKTLNR